MFNQYHEDIVTTKTGVVDVEYYKQEASRLRSEHTLELYKTTVDFLKCLFVTRKDIDNAARNMFKVDKLAR